MHDMHGLSGDRVATCAMMAPIAAQRVIQGTS